MEKSIIYPKAAFLEVAFPEDETLASLSPIRVHESLKGVFVVASESASLSISLCAGAYKSVK